MEDELGPPPPAGLVVRPEDEGFYVRLYPSPAPQLGVVVGVAAVFGVLGAVIGVIASPELVVQVWVGLGSIAFGLLLWGFSFGQGFFPLELIGDERCLAWGGDRFLWSQIGSASAQAGTLEIQGHDGRVLAQIKHLRPDVSAWTARLIELSLEPEHSSDSSTER